MKISAGSVSLMPDSVSGVKNGANTFRDILNDIRNSSTHDLTGLTEKLLTKGGTDPRELIRAQVAVSHYNFRVECASKLTESLVSLPRRLQQA